MSETRLAPGRRAATRDAPGREPSSAPRRRAVPQTGSPQTGAPRRLAVSEPAAQRPLGSRSVGSRDARALRVTASPRTTAPAAVPAARRAAGRRSASRAAALRPRPAPPIGAIAVRVVAALVGIVLVAALVVAQLSGRDAHADNTRVDVGSDASAGEPAGQLASSVAAQRLIPTAPHDALLDSPAATSLLVANNAGEQSSAQSSATSSAVSSFASLLGDSDQLAGQSRTHTVVAGDTLATIATRYGVSPAILAQLNELADPSHIRAGQELVIAEKVVPRASAAPTEAKALPVISPSRVRSDPARMALLPLFRKWASANRVPVDLLMAMCWQESGWDNTARSSVGAMGIGQLMPGTVEHARQLIEKPDLDPDVADDNIRMSARYLRYVLAQYQGNEALALVAYYQGPEALARDGVLPGATEYVERITALRVTFAALA